MMQSQRNMLLDDLRHPGEQECGWHTCVCWRSIDPGCAAIV